MTQEVGNMANRQFHYLVKLKKTQNNDISKSAKRYELHEYHTKSFIIEKEAKHYTKSFIIEKEAKYKHLKKLKD